MKGSEGRRGHGEGRKGRLVLGQRVSSREGLGA
jgi:hypothetical protein